MGFSLRKIFDESVAQITPSFIDHGKTAATVARQAPPPATTRPSLMQQTAHNITHNPVTNFVGNDIKKTLNFNPSEQQKSQQFQTPTIRVPKLISHAVDTVANADKAIVNTAEDVGHYVARTPDTIVRSSAQASYDTLNKLTGDHAPKKDFSAGAPTDSTRKVLYGNDPVETYQKRAEGNKKVIEGSRFRGLAGPATPLLAAATIAGDVSGTGSIGKKGAEEAVAKGAAAAKKPSPLADLIAKHYKGAGTAAHQDEQDALVHVLQNPEKTMQNYDDRVKAEFGVSKPNIVAGDEAKYVIPGFDATKSGTYHEPASAVAKAKYDQLLGDKTTKDKPVMIMAGGSGAGKTSGIKAVLKGNNKSLDDYAAVVDTNSNKLESAKGKIDHALKSGRPVDVHYVYRDPVDAFQNGVVPRARTQGRIVPIDAHVDTHFGSRDVAEQLAQEYKDHPDVNVHVIDNSRGRGKQTPVPIENLPKIGYTRDSLRNELQKVIQNEHDTQQITPEELQTYLGSKEARPGEQAALQSDEHVPSPGNENQPVATPGFTAPTLNKSKYNVSEDAQKELDTLAKDVQPDIEKKVGRKLSLDEIKQTADATGRVLTDAKNRAATLNYTSSLLNAREQLAALVEKRAAGAISPDEEVELNKVYATVKAAAADAGRTLNAFKEKADPHEQTIIDVMIDRINKTGAKLEDIHAALEKLGPDPSPQDLTDFYREFVKATKGDWLDKFRYTNMLSSPLTHIVNAASNAQGVFGAAPVQKLAEGMVDATKSALTGSERTRFASEAGSYLKGAAGAIPEAGRKFLDVVEGRSMMGNPDFDSLRNIPLATKGVAGVADDVLSFVPKLLEAGDQFFTTMAKGGEKAALNKRAVKGVKNVDLSNVNIAKVADEAATYRLFRQQLGKQGQGYVLDMMDAVPKAVQEWRNSKNPLIRNVSKFTFPFISTPTNIFKQGLEYGPTGLLTIPGSADKTAQAAKALMGTTVVATAAGALAAKDAITFAEPTDSKQRDAFRAEGKQPYSIKIGNKWFGYSKLHPAIAFNLATVGAVKDALDKGSIDESTADKFLTAASGVLGFFRDQSYMKSVGDFTSILQSKDGASLGDLAANQIANTANQLAPFKSMTSWIGRMLDPTQRKVDYAASTADQIFQSMVKDIPGLNKNVPARQNPYDKSNLTNPHPNINSLSPVRVSDDKGFGNTTGLNVEQRQIQQAMPGGQKEDFRRGVVEDKFKNKKAQQEEAAIKSGKNPDISAPAPNSNKTPNAAVVRQLSNGKYYAKLGEDYKTYPSKDKAQKAVDKYNQDQTVEKFKNSDSKQQEIGDKLYYKTKDGDVKSKSKSEYDYDKQNASLKLTMDRAKSSGDVKSWLDAADKKYAALEAKKQQFDPDTESDQIDAITLQQENLKDEAAKYQDQGGFTKGKKKGKSSSNGFDYKPFTYSDPTSTNKSLRSLLHAARVTRSRA